MSIKKKTAFETSNLSVYGQMLGWTTIPATVYNTSVENPSRKGKNVPEKQLKNDLVCFFCGAPAGLCTQCWRVFILKK